MAYFIRETIEQTNPDQAASFDHISESGLYGKLPILATS